MDGRERIRMQALRTEQRNRRIQYFEIGKRARQETGEKISLTREDLNIKNGKENKNTNKT